MDMHVDQPREQGHSRQVDVVRTRSDGPILDGHRRDAPVRDGDLGSRHNPAGDNVHHSICGNHHRICEGEARQKQKSGR
jgi:hypothetical protein